jgi:hypothetical protein
VNRSAAILDATEKALKSAKIKSTKKKASYFVGRLIRIRRHIKVFAFPTIAPEKRFVRRNFGMRLPMPYKLGVSFRRMT